ncbi:MAG TPA: DinB family protein [Anaerolineae bacterium]|nr:DinB family protein [Anaerolineae bacterium]
MTEQFEACDMAGATFHRVNLGQATFNDVNLGEAVFENVNLAGARIRNANLMDLRIDDANITRLTIFGIRVDELIEAEKDRRDPERARLRMSDRYAPQVVRAMLARLDEVRQTFRELLRATPPEVLNTSPGPGRWSALEHVRHLVFAEDLFLNRRILNNDTSLHTLGLLPDFIADDPAFPGVGSDACRDLETVLAAWDESHAVMLAYLADLTPEKLHTVNHEERPRTVADILQVMAHHDLEHIRWVERVLEELQSPA